MKPADYVAEYAEGRITVLDTTTLIVRLDNDLSRVGIRIASRRWRYDTNNRG